MSLILSSVDANIELLPCLRPLQSKHSWTRKYEKGKKSVRWSDSLVEVIEIPCQEKETEFVAKKPSLKDREALGSFTLLADLFYSTVNDSMEVNNCLGEGVRVNNPSNSQNLDVKHFCSSYGTTAEEKELSFNEREDEACENDTSCFHLGPGLRCASDEVITDNEVVVNREQAATDNLQYILASLSSFSGEGKRYLNVMF